MWYFSLCKMIDIVFHLRLIAAENIRCFVEIRMQVCNSGSWIKNCLHCKKYRKYYSHIGSKTTSKNAKTKVKNFFDVRLLLWVIIIGVPTQTQLSHRYGHTAVHVRQLSVWTSPFELLAFIWYKQTLLLSEYNHIFITTSILGQQFPFSLSISQSKTWNVL